MHEAENTVPGCGLTSTRCLSHPVTLNAKVFPHRHKLCLLSHVVYPSVAVLAKQVAPTVGYADEDLFLPQWAIAGIVIGLASLLFVIIFGVTVVSNKLFSWVLFCWG